MLTGHISLRRQYLRLLLLHPYAPASKDAETHLWMQTSYTFISNYKQRIVELDTALQSAPRQSKSNDGGGAHGPVEYRKLLRHFRQFLAEEEKFWTQLLTRCRRSFALDELHPALVTLGCVSQSGEEEGQDGGDAERRSGGRNHFQFPPEEDTSSISPTNASQRAALLSTCSKMLVCLGDLARYKEQYNEGGGRPKAGREDGPPAMQSKRNPRNRATADESRTRNYESAQQRYEQARLLCPSEGNASHQLAILAAYQKDPFGALVHYYRAMCVRQPYETAAENLGTVLKKALKQWKSSRSSTQKDGAVTVPRFKENAVVLHALWHQLPNSTETERQVHVLL
jgi:protein SMG7